MSSVLREIEKERRNQIERGFTPDHDDDHIHGGLRAAAICFVEPDAMFADYWPWSDYKPDLSNHRVNLIKAAALLVAEIERMDRAKL
jgi:hypothetical protein